MCCSDYYVATAAGVTHEMHWALIGDGLVAKTVERMLIAGLIFIAFTHTFF